jgi:hypothetical protein
MPWSPDDPAFREAFAAISARLRACPACGIDAARLLQAVRAPRGRCIETTCTLCGFVSVFNVDVDRGGLPATANEG